MSSTYDCGVQLECSYDTCQVFERSVECRRHVSVRPGRTGSRHPTGASYRLLLLTGSGLCHRKSRDGKSQAVFTLREVRSAPSLDCRVWKQRVMKFVLYPVSFSMGLSPLQQPHPYTSLSQGPTDRTECPSTRYRSHVQSSPTNLRIAEGMPHFSSQLYPEALLYRYCTVM